MSSPPPITFTTVLPPESDTKDWQLISTKWLALNGGDTKAFPVAPTDSAQSVVFEIITSPFSVVKASIVQPPRTTLTQVNPPPPTQSAIFPPILPTSHTTDTTSTILSAASSNISQSSPSTSKIYSASPDNNTTPANKLSAGAMAGIALGGLILLGIALGAWYFCVHHRRRQQDSGLSGGVLGDDERLVPTSYPFFASRPRNRKEVPRLPGKREALTSTVALASASATDQEGPGRREPLQDPFLAADTDELDRPLPDSSGERHLDAGPVLSFGRSPSGRLPPAYGEQPPAYRAAHP
ncbi:hypothetical protein C8F01DRAFT_697534 [Mycena amicta]|nr:hypothetical protein C8F01DRAFT_697534 [Mycena amicta]